jgi:general secretion pathway protein F
LGELATWIGQRLREGQSLSQIVSSDQDRFPPVWQAVLEAGLDEEGLVDLGHDMPTGAGEPATWIGRRLRVGSSLSEILSRDQDRFPPVWRAVVQAGLRSGRLSVALEGLATTARRVAETRRAVCVAWIYPLIVMALAFAFFLFFVTSLFPGSIFENLQMEFGPFMSCVSWLGQYVHIWGIAVPLLVVFAFFVAWRRSGRVLWSRGGSRRASEFSARRGRWPTAANTLRYGRLAAFAEVLALLVDHDVSYAEAIALAGDASGDPALGDASRSVAERLQRGEVFASRADVPAQFPPFLGWLLVTATQQPGLSDRLRQTAEIYRQRAARAVTWNAVYLPMVLTVVFGGSAVLLYALTVFMPVIKLLYGLS